LTEREPPDADLETLDVRGLEPPEPMVQTLEALERLPVGKVLVHINTRVPRMLLPKLTERGFSYEIREESPDLVRVFIRRSSIRPLS
jgi:tRNA 2-thiouridine synthesizing protein A